MMSITPSLKKPQFSRSLSLGARTPSSTKGLGLSADSRYSVPNVRHSVSFPLVHPSCPRLHPSCPRRAAQTWSQVMPLQTSLEVATSTKKTPDARLSEALNELAKLGTGTEWRPRTRESDDWIIVRMGHWHDTATAVLRRHVETTYVKEQGAAQAKMTTWLLTKRACLEAAYEAGHIPRIDVLQQVVSLFLHS